MQGIVRRWKARENPAERVLLHIDKGQRHRLIPGDFIAQSPSTGKA